MQRRGRKFAGCVLEVSVAKAITERVEGLASEIAVGTIFHGVVVKRRKLIGACVKGNGQSTRGIVFSEECFGDGGASRLPGIPRFKDRSRLLFGALQSQRAAVHEDENKRFACGGQRRDELLLYVGEFDDPAISAIEFL